MPLTDPPEIPLITEPSTFSQRAQDWVVWQADELYPFLTDSAALLGLSASATSTTSNTIGTGSKSFTVETGKGFIAGMSLSIARTAAPNNRMFCVVVSYNSGTGDLVVTSQAFEGSGTFTDWSIAPAFNGVVATAQIQDLAVTTAKITDSNVTTAKIADANVTLAKLEAAAKTDKIQPITASVAANALTITLNPTTLDFRANPLTSGTVSTVSNAAAISLVISSGSTLGSANAVATRLAVLAINNAGTMELAAVNMSGGNNLDESTLISTTAEGGAGGADSISTIYSTTARASVAFRVVGYIDYTQATAGTYATAPSRIQGAGGESTNVISQNSTVRVDTTANYGSTNTAIRRFLNVRVNQGADITYADSATLGGSFTINTPGMYAMSFFDNFTGGGDLGISLNSTQLTTAIGSITATDRIAEGTTSAAGFRASCSVTTYLKAGDVIRAHTSGVASSTADMGFTISRVS